jgi:hypothetical protein
MVSTMDKKLRTEFGRQMRKIKRPLLLAPVRNKAATTLDSKKLLHRVRRELNVKLTTDDIESVFHSVFGRWIRVKENTSEGKKVRTRITSAGGGREGGGGERREKTGREETRKDGLQGEE